MAFVSLPCRSSQEVDLKKPIRRYIDKTYGPTQATTVASALDSLQDMRKSVLSKLRDKNATAANLIAKYHDTLLSLESRISLSETEARVDWKWTDITGKQKKLCTGEFERANLLFCYAAIHSQLAEASDQRDANGLKQAVISLKTAAGVFDYLASNCSMFGGSNPDSTYDILTAYATVMQAQAQECVFLKAEQGNLPPGLIAKVASKALELYEDGSKRCGTWSIKPYIPRDWNNSLTGKSHLYAALAQYYQAKDCEASGNYGERVARFMHACDLMKSAARCGFRQSWVDQLKRERDLAIKDNDLIYHAHVPAVKELSSVPTESALGKIEVELPLLKGKAPDLFIALVPLKVQETKSRAEGILHSLLGAETHRLRTMTDELNAVMMSLNLPAAIQLSVSDQSNKNLLDKASNIRMLGGSARLHEQVYSLPQSAQRNREILQQQSSTLDMEQQTDDQLRQQYGNRWTRQPSARLNENWRADLTKMMKFLEETEKTDATLAKRYEEQAYYFDLLSKPADEILCAIREAEKDSTTSPTGSESVRESLAQLCSKVELLKSDRNSLTDQLNNITLSNDVVSKFVAYNERHEKVGEQQILDLLNEELEGSRTCVRASEEEQKDLLAQLQDKYEAYFGCSRSQNNTGLATRLNAAADAYLTLDKDVKEGMKFYAELTERCLKVQEKIDDFCLARSTEKSECLADITTGVGNVTIDAGPCSPTPPPPAQVTTTAVNPPPRPPPTYSAPPNYPSQPTAPYEWPTPPFRYDMMPPYQHPMPFPAYPNYGMPYPSTGMMPTYGFPAIPGIHQAMTYTQVPGYAPMPNQPSNPYRPPQP